MAAPTLTQLKTRYEEIKDLIADKASTLSDESAEKSAKTLAAKDIQDLNQEMNEIEASVMAATSREKALDSLMGISAKAGGHRSIGEAFTSAELYKACNGDLPVNQSVKLEADFKTLITGASSTSGGALVADDFRGDLFNMNATMREFTLLDLVTMIPTQSDAVVFPRMTSITNAAAETAEATSTSNGAKPESAMALEQVTVAIQNIAHWIPVTTRILQDASMIQGLINEVLIYGLREQLEDQLIGGSGTPPALKGISSHAGLLTEAFSTNIITSVRKARTTLRVSGRARPTAIAMSPADWESCDLAVDGENRFYWGGPSALGIPRLWAVPVVESEAVSDGTAYMGDWKQLVVFTNNGITLKRSDSHSDFFIRNIEVLLAEMRCGIQALSDKAFIEIATA